MQHVNNTNKRRLLCRTWLAHTHSPILTHTRYKMSNEIAERLAMIVVENIPKQVERARQILSASFETFDWESIMERAAANGCSIACIDLKKMFRDDDNMAQFAMAAMYYRDFGTKEVGDVDSFREIMHLPDWLIPATPTLLLQFQVFVTLKLDISNAKSICVVMNPSVVALYHVPI